MTEPLHFISYSRREYHFAESLTLHLQYAGINVWFDNQQIRPGEDWQTDIQAGLLDSDALILVASKASLESPYVRQECLHALNTNKPIYVVIFETIKLPKVLKKAAAVIDFRANFAKGLEALLECSQRGKGQYDPINQPPQWLLGVSSGVRWAALTLFWYLSVWVIVTGYYLFAANWASSIDPVTNGSSIRTEVFCLSLLSLILIALGSPILLLWRGFIRRTFSPSRIQQVLIVVFGLQILTCIRFAFFSQPRLIEVFILVSTVISGYLLYRFWYNADYLRWCPLGDDMRGWRVKVHQALVPVNDNVMPVSVQFFNRIETTLNLPLLAEPIYTEFADKTYRLHYFSGDEPLATEISESVKHIGYYEVTKAEPDYHILLLNPWTPLALIDEVCTFPNLICILASSVEMSDQVKKLKKFQWIDYRTRSKAALMNAFQAIDTRDRTGSTLNLQPPQLHKYTLPTELAPTYRWTRWIAAWSIGTTLSHLFLFTTNRDYSQAATILGIANLLLLGYGFYLFQLADGIIGLKQTPVNLLLLGLLPLGIFAFQIITTRLIFRWNGESSSLIGELLLLLPQIVFVAWLGRKFWTSVRKLEQLGILTDEPGISPVFRTPVMQSARQVAGSLLIYSLIWSIGLPILLLILVIYAVYLNFMFSQRRMSAR